MTRSKFHMFYVLLMTLLLGFGGIVAADTEFPAPGKTGVLQFTDASNWTDGLPNLTDNPGTVRLPGDVLAWYSFYADLNGMNFTLEPNEVGETGILKHTGGGGTGIGTFETQLGGASVVTVNGGTWEPFGDRKGLLTKGCTVTVNDGFLDCDGKQIEFRDQYSEIILNGGVIKASKLLWFSGPARGVLRLNGGLLELTAGTALHDNSCRLDFSADSFCLVKFVNNNYISTLQTRVANNVFSIDGTPISDFNAFDRFEYDPISNATYLQLNPDPSIAQNVFPAKAQQAVERDVTFRWGPGDVENITKYYLYYKVGDADLSTVTPIEVDADLDNNGFVDAESSHGPVNFNFDDTVFWRVDESISDSGPDDLETIQGDLWTFTVLTPEPVISQQPLGQVRGPANEKSDAEFTVVATADIGTLSYQWSKDGSPLGNGPTGSGSVISGATGDTLNIVGVTESDEGEYVCQVTTNYNSSMVSVDTDTAILEYAQIVGHWAFENNLDDSINGNNGSWNGPANPYSAGIVGTSALTLDSSTDPNVVTLPAAVIPDNTAEFSISFWIKNTAAAEYTGIVFRADPCDIGNPVVRVHAPYNLNITFDAGNTNGFDRVQQQISSYADELQDQWVHIVGVKDVEAETMKLYINGVLIKTDTNETRRYFGTDSVTLGGNVIGMIDDLRVYNYAIDSVEIGVMYTDVQGGSVCAGLDDPVLQKFDVNGDCQISVVELADIIAANWLYCLTVPDCVN